MSGPVGGEVDVGAVVPWCNSSGLQTWEWKGRWKSDDGVHVIEGTRL